MIDLISVQDTIFLNLDKNHFLFFEDPQKGQQLQTVAFALKVNSQWENLDQYKAYLSTNVMSRIRPLIIDELWCLLACISRMEWMSSHSSGEIIFCSELYSITRKQVFTLLVLYELVISFSVCFGTSTTSASEDDIQITADRSTPASATTTAKGRKGEG